MHKKHIVHLLILLGLVTPTHPMSFLRSTMRNHLVRAQQAGALLYRRPLLGRKVHRPRFSAHLRRSGKFLVPAGMTGAVMYAHQDQSPTPRLWTLRAQGNSVPRKEMVDAFVQDCAQYQAYNAALPKHVKNEETVRIATYNVHNWCDPYETHNFDAIMATIKDVNADVLLIQECSLFDKERIEEALHTCGYAHALFGATIKDGTQPIGNMIVSRYPLQNSATHTYKLMLLILLNGVILSEQGFHYRTIDRSLSLVLI